MHWERWFIMRNNVSLNFNLNKIEKTFLFSLLVSVGMLIAVGNIYWICGKFGIRLAPGWYQDIVDFVLLLGLHFQHGLHQF